MFEVPIVMVVVFRINHRVDYSGCNLVRVNELRAVAFSIHVDLSTYGHLALYCYAVSGRSFYQCNVNNSVAALHSVFFALQTELQLDYVDTHLWHFGPFGSFDSYSCVRNLPICHFWNETHRLKQVLFLGKKNIKSKYWLLFKWITRITSSFS